MVNFTSVRATWWTLPFTLPWYAGFWGHTDLYLPQDLNTYPVHKPSDQHGRHPKAGPTHPTPRGQAKPQVRESWAQPPKLCRVDVLIHFSQTSSNVMRNWCRPLAQPSPSWRRWVGFWRPFKDCYSRNNLAKAHWVVCLRSVKVLTVNNRITWTLNVVESTHHDTWSWMVHSVDWQCHAHPVHQHAESVECETHRKSFAVDQELLPPAEHSQYLQPQDLVSTLHSHYHHGSHSACTRPGSAGRWSCQHGQTTMATWLSSLTLLYVAPAVSVEISDVVLLFLITHTYMHTHITLLAIFKVNISQLPTDFPFPFIAKLCILLRQRKLYTSSLI